MADFWRALQTTPFLQYALLTGLLASVACGVVGTYVVVRRITYIAGGIAHSVLGGIGAAMYVSRAAGWEWLHPLYGATAAALVAAGIIGVASLRLREREDTVISALWAVGMAGGVVFIALMPGYQQDLMSYLFGDILMVGRTQLWMLAGLDAVVVGVAAIFFRQLQAVCFDEEFARTRGLAVDAYYLLLLALIALTVVLLVTVVGIVLTIALLTLPVAVAGQFARRMGTVMIAAAVLCGVLTTGGLALSYAPDLPAGPVTILLAGGLYLLVLLGRRIVRRRPAVSGEGPTPDGDS